MKSLSRNKLWAFRLAAVFLGLLPFVGLEVALRLLDWPRRPPAADPFVDLHNLRPLFEISDEAPERLQIAAERMRLFRPASFSRTKAPGTFRIFALGGSTTQGEPYSTETAFPQWLQIGLSSAVPEKSIEVVNCGGLSYASYRVLAILKEVLNYDPDLIVVYTGHNEFLEKRTYEGYDIENPAMRATSWLAELRLVQLTRNLVGASSERQDPSQRHPTVLATEVDALLDYQGGLEDYHRTDDWHAAVQEHFRWNLEQMVRSCREVQVPLLLIKPVSNLADCPPIKFESDVGLNPDRRAQFEHDWDRARRATTPEEAYRAVRSALAVDGDHAGANYLLGKWLLDRGDVEAAKHHLTQARDLDVCPLRAPTGLIESVRDIAERHQVPLVDAEQLFAEQSPHKIVGSRWLVDHIHPSVEGHQLLGVAIAEKCLATELLAAPQSDWRSRLGPAFEQHLAGLGEAYFQRGQQRLQGLLLWTQGRAKKVRSEEQVGP